MDCIFCKIANKELPGKFLYEDENIFVIQDIKPLAPLHLLAIPKKHIESIDHLTEEDKDLVGSVIMVAQKVAREQGIDQTGYQLIFNVGKGGGQVVPHLHLHLLGGWKNN